MEAADNRYGVPVDLIGFNLFCTVFSGIYSQFVDGGIVAAALS